jgi:Domain of unknown function (DUF4129)
LGRSAAAAAQVEPWLAPAVVLALLLAARLAWWMWSRRRRPREQAPRERRRQDLAQAVDVGVDALRSDPDPRRAVIRAYVTMERSLGAAGVARRPFEAPYEYLRRAAREVAAAPEELSLLTRLFGLARFSQHPVDEPGRHRAIAALARVRDQVGRP